ncbi:Vesicle transport protein SFT2A [Lamellibrachia satsuma]|nr:Vesicle transport protein SFT2A [Lamellibrachia satsuma]
MEKLKSAFSGRENDDDGIMTEISDATTFSWSTRIKGFIACFVLGIVMSLLGSFFLMLPNGLKLFALFYTFGSILALCSTFFLMGPMKQLKRMFAETRIYATIVVIVCIALTLCSALWWRNTGLAILFCILQFLAMTWYSLSYIPFARDAVTKGCSSCMS